MYVCMYAHQLKTEFDEKVSRFLSVCMCMYVCMYVCGSVYPRHSLTACMYDNNKIFSFYSLLHTYIHKYIRIYIHTYIQTYIHAYIDTYIHTYIHAVHIYVHNSNGSLCMYYFHCVVNQSDIVDWGYTVGHPDLIDADTRRGGPWGKQTCIETIIERLIVHVTQRRRYNFYKILPTPLKIHFFDSKELEYTNLSEFLELDENQDK